MALKGSLDDFGVLELVQYPHNRKRTGQLVIESPNIGEVFCFYKDGRLVHVKSKKNSGLEALVDVVRLKKGNFEFNQKVEVDKESIKLDLHKAIMQALKMSDERQKVPSKDRKKEEEKLAKIKKELNTTISSSESYMMISYIIECKTVVHEVYGQDVKEKKPLIDLREYVCDINSAFPNGMPDSIIINNSDFIVVTGKTIGNSLLLIVGNNTLSPGAANMSVNKLSSRITHIVSGE